MKVKNAINSEECNDLRNLIGQVNAVVGRINRISEDEDELHKAAGLLTAAQKILCKKFGEALNQTLLCAQDIEADEKQPITFLSRGKDVSAYDEAPQTDTTEVADGTTNEP